MKKILAAAVLATALPVTASADYLAQCSAAQIAGNVGVCAQVPATNPPSTRLVCVDQAATDALTQPGVDCGDSSTFRTTSNSDLGSLNGAGAGLVALGVLVVAAAAAGGGGTNGTTN